MTSIDKEHMINCNEDILDKSIYRVFKIEHLLEWFKTGKLVFCSPNEWKDPWEAHLFKKSFCYDKDYRGFLPYLNLCYAQCWSLNNEDSDLVWKLYSPSENGVRVKTSIRKLIKHIISSDEFKRHEHKYHKTECYIGQMKYMKKNEIKKVNSNIKKCLDTDFKFPDEYRVSKNVIEILFRKLTEYTHENEIRFVFSTNDFDEICSITPKLFHFTINPFETIDEVLFDPRMDENLVNCYKTFLRSRYNFNKEIEQSSFIQIRGK